MGLERSCQVLRAAIFLLPQPHLLIRMRPQAPASEVPEPPLAKPEALLGDATLLITGDSASVVELPDCHFLTHFVHKCSCLPTSAFSAESDIDSRAGGVSSSRLAYRLLAEVGSPRGWSLPISDAAAELISACPLACAAEHFL